MKKVLWSVDKVRGFTLIELMVTLSVLAIITMIATPSLASALENQKLKQAALDVKIALQQARTQAVLTNSRQVLCPTAHPMSQESCGEVLKNYEKLTTTQKNNQINVIILDEKVQFKTGSATHFVFTPQGYTTEQTVTLCASDRSYVITVYMPGHVEMLQGSTCT